MAGTIDKTTPTPEVAPPVPPVEEPQVVVPDDASRLCVNCAALLEEGQDWCLECGTAQPGRISGKPGWRAALIVVGVVALLAAGAVAAAYAALSSDAEHSASAPPPPAAEPIVPTPPVQTTPAPEETPPVAAPENNTESPAPKAPKDSSPDPAPTPAPSAGSSGDSFSGGSADTSPGSVGGSTDTEDEGGTTDTAPDPLIALGPDAASTFDPHDRAGGLTGDPADAIDGRPKTSWEAPVRAEDGRVDIGLLVSLEKAQAIDKVRLMAGTPGFTVELWGSKLGTAPDNAPGATKYWQKIDETFDFGTDEKLDVGGKTYRHVLLWFTDQPADTKVMIPEVELLRPVK